MFFVFWSYKIFLQRYIQEQRNYPFGIKQLWQFDDLKNAAILYGKMSSFFICYSG